MRFGDFLFLNKRWLGAGAVMSFSSSFGQTFFISIFAGALMAEFGLSDGEWGGIYSLGTTASAIVMVYGGTLTDRFRARYLAAAVLVLLAGACLFMARVPGVWALPFAVFLLRFTGQGMLNHIAVVAMARWFVAARGRALAIATLGFSFGEAFLPMIFVGLLTVMAWRELWVVAAIASLAIIPVVMALLRSERTPQSITAGDNQTGLENRHWTRRETLRHWLFWTLIPMVTAPSIFGTALFFQQVHLTETKGWDHTGFVTLFPIFTGTTIASMFVFGWAIDRFGCRRLLAWFQVPMALAYLTLSLGTTLSAAAVGFFLMGLMQGGGATLFGAMWAEFYGTRHLGAIKSLATALMVFGSAIGPGVTGLLIDLGFPFHVQMLGYAAYIMAGCMLTWVAMRRV